MAGRATLPRSYPAAVRIDLNADLGEGVGDDSALLGIVTSANLATGAHAGGGAVLQQSVATAARHGVAIGAHPAYRDRAGFGRRSELAALRAEPAGRARFVADLVDQVLTVAGEARRCGVGLQHVKAHGALYNEAVVDEVAAALLVAAVTEVGDRLGGAPAVVTQPGGVLAQLAEEAGLAVLAEGFVDRGYLPSGSLVPRGRPGALHAGTAAMTAQALDLARGRVHAVDGTWVALRVDTLCVHGDTPGAVAAARLVRAALEAAGWRVAAPGSEA
jgi:UPF0271 protein